jgi:hypothetical protein
VSVDFELEDREPLRDTPEGELWTSVLVDAIEDLAASIEWLRSTYGKRRAQLERDSQTGVLEPARYRERLRELERERRDSEIQIESCTWFFSHPDSPLEFICDVLAYPVDLIRKHARRSLEVPVKVEAPAGLESAPEPELQSAAEAEHEPEIEPLIEPTVEPALEPAYVPIHFEAA